VGGSRRKRHVSTLLGLLTYGWKVLRTAELGFPDDRPIDKQNK